MILWQLREIDKIDLGFYSKDDSDKILFQFCSDLSIAKLFKSIKMFANIWKSYSRFDNSSNFFSFNIRVYYWIGLSLWHNSERFYKIFTIVSALFLTGYWYFILSDFYNHLFSLNLDAFMESLSLYIVHLMGLYKFILLVWKFVIILLSLYLFIFDQ